MVLFHYNKYKPDSSSQMILGECYCNYLTCDFRVESTIIVEMKYFIYRKRKTMKTSFRKVNIQAEKYFNFALLDVVPFWHAVRANSMLGDVDDPFQKLVYQPCRMAGRFGNPWWDDPPLNDGNKHRNNSSSLLRWDDSYGNQDIGTKFNSVAWRDFEDIAYYKFINMEMNTDPDHADQVYEPKGIRYRLNVAAER